MMTARRLTFLMWRGVDFLPVVGAIPIGRWFPRSDARDSAERVGESAE